MRPLLTILVFLHCAALAISQKNASVTWNPETKEFVIHESIVDKWVAWATFTDEISTTGWSYLEVWTNKLYKDSFQAYAAGLVEGYLTADLITKHWKNLYGSYCDNEKVYCERLRTFLQTNMDFMNHHIDHRRTNSMYWHQVALILEQVQGVEDGYKNTPLVPDTRPDVFGVMLFNLFGDLEDLEHLLNKTNKRKDFGNGHCSALIKLLPNYEDLYVAHDTWNSYNTMLRILKKYVMPFKVTDNPISKTVPGHTMSFSSYPGTIFSGDDFYIISTGLIAIETTNGNSNPNLFKYIKPNKIVLEWIRNVVANRLAKRGEQWTFLFKWYNSGTYNNQWMIVDYKRFLPGKRPSQGLLWILEQIPGYIERKDKTNLLLQQGYWSSYNRPYYPKIFNTSGFLDKVKEYGDWFTHDKTARALIFKRDEGKVHDLTAMTKIMRYNNYKHDPLSRCNCTPPYSADNAIASRSDLNPPNGTYSIPALGNLAQGAIDMKLTNYSMHKTYQFISYSGPTYDQQVPFQWSKSDFVNVSHEGHPDLWKFKSIIHHWLNL